MVRLWAAGGRWWGVGLWCAGVCGVVGGCGRGSGGPGGAVRVVRSGWCSIAGRVAVAGGAVAGSGRSGGRGDYRGDGGCSPLRVLQRDVNGRTIKGFRSASGGSGGGRDAAPPTGRGGSVGGVLAAGVGWRLLVGSSPSVDGWRSGSGRGGERVDGVAVPDWWPGGDPSAAFEVGGTVGGVRVVGSTPRTGRVLSVARLAPPVSAGGVDGFECPAAAFAPVAAGFGSGAHRVLRSSAAPSHPSACQSSPVR